MSHEEEIGELIFYITGMRRTFNKRLDDHLYIMQQQNNTIEQQMRIIEEQKQVVDELAWQIRDLRDSVRQVSEKKNHCVCNYENHQSRYRIKENDTFYGRKKHEISSIIEDDEEAFYEPVNFNAGKNQQTTGPTNNIKQLNSLRVRDYHANKINYSEIVKISKENNHNEDNKGWLRTGPSMIGRTDNATKNTKTSSLSEAISKLKLLDIANRDSIDEDIVLREQHFKRYSRNALRGSSKVLCSLISDIEEDYLPHEEELQDENFVHLTRDVVSDAVVDYTPTSSGSQTSNKRLGIMK